MQFSAVENRFIVKTYLNSTLSNDLKRNFFFRKMFIVTDLVTLNVTCFVWFVSSLMDYVMSLFFFAFRTKKC